MKEELQKLEKKLKRLYNRNFPNPVNWSEVEETRREIEETEEEIEEIKKEIKKEIKILDMEIFRLEKCKSKNQFSKRILEMLDGQIRLRKGAIKELEQQLKELEDEHR